MCASRNGFGKLGMVGRSQGLINVMLKIIQRKWTEIKLNSWG